MTVSSDTPLPIARDSADENAAIYWRGRFISQFGLGVVVLSILSGLVTLAVLAGTTPIDPTGKVVFYLEVINAILVLAMVSVISWQVIRLWLARRRGIAGARLHVRLVTLFSLVAAIPALIVVAFASVTLDRGLETMFSKSTRAIVDNAYTVAESYIRGHSKVMRVGMNAMIETLAQPNVKKTYETDKANFSKLLNTLRGLSAFHSVYLVNGEGRVLNVSADRPRPPPPRPPDWALKDAKAGKMSVLSPNRADLVVGIARLKGYDNIFIYAYRYIDPQAVKNLDNARIGKAQYLALETQRKELQITFALIAISVSLVFLLAAIWIGLSLADRLVAPIVRLMDAARKVSRGKFDVKVPVRRSEGDLATLGTTFNNMTSKLSSQHRELTGANDMLSERRRFIEAVLSGVSSGIIGLNKKGKITLVNRSTQDLLGIKEKDLLGKPLAKAVPVFQPVFDKAVAKAAGRAEGQVIFRRDMIDHNFVVRIMVEQHGAKADFGYVLTFDDTTELVTAQRNSAWADIARRIAHEIKNPLTPIQLSAERLKRRYGEKVGDDDEVFAQCTETIIRQVGDIGRMVDEFSSFARMPKAKLEEADLVEVVKQAILLQRVSQEAIVFAVDLPDKPVLFDFDRRLVSQAVTNLVKNATEAIEARIEQQPKHKGRISVQLHRKADIVNLDVIDNGIGLPRENRTRLVEPYMTTREKGTGLGLAIVTKIMEEHSGKIVLRDAPGLGKKDSGAMVRMAFPVEILKPKTQRKKARKATSGKTSQAGNKRPMRARKVAKSPADTKANKTKPAKRSAPLSVT